jgi:CRP-like cAMP-binding protein
VIKAGQTEDYLYFVESGILRFYVESGEKEITTDFAFQGSFTSAYSSFITRRPTIYNIEALTDVSLWRIHYTDLQEVYRQNPAGQALGRMAAEQLFIRKTEREVSLLRDKPEERYLALLEQNPQLVQQIPLKYLASYIGITPQALSRIRKRIA